MKPTLIPAELLKALVDEGIVPPDCRALTLEIVADGALMLRYEVFLSRDHLIKLARAFTVMAKSESVQ